MSTAPPTVDWPQREPYKSLIRTAEGLEERGFSVEEVIRGLLCVCTALDARAHGPQMAATRLRIVADRYEQEAARDANYPG